MRVSKFPLCRLFFEHLKFIFDACYGKCNHLRGLRKPPKIFDCFLFHARIFIFQLPTVALRSTTNAQIAFFPIAFFKVRDL